MMLGWCFFFLISGVMPAYKSEDCRPQDVDVIDLARMNIFQTISLQDERLTEEAIEEGMRGEKLPADYVKFIDEREAFQRQIESGEASKEYGEVAGSSPDEAAEKARLNFEYYHPICPYRYYVLARYKWTFLQYGEDTRKYCWPYYTVYATSCTTRLCNFSFQTNVLPWTPQYRCIPEYRITWVYARCVTITGGSYVWSNEFVRRSLPRGCSCRRLGFAYAINRQCPVTIATAGEDLQ